MSLRFVVNAARLRKVMLTEIFGVYQVWKICVVKG